MADHINIHHPRERTRDLPEQVLIAELRARVDVIERHRSSLMADLDAIFMHIERGDRVELHCSDGRIFVVTGEELK